MKFPDLRSSHIRGEERREAEQGEGEGGAEGMTKLNDVAVLDSSNRPVQEAAVAYL